MQQNGSNVTAALKKDTWLQNSNLKYGKIILFIYNWRIKLTSIKFYLEELEIGSNLTVIYWTNVLSVCAGSLLKQPTVIGGEGLTLVTDESVFSKRKYNLGKLLSEQWVLGGIY